MRRILVQPDGKILAGGWFDMTISRLMRRGTYRLHSDDNLDTNYNPGVCLPGADHPYVTDLALQTDGKLVMVVQASLSLPPSTNHLYRFNTDSTRDTGFVLPVEGAKPRISSVACQPDGKVLVGGDVTVVNGQARNRIARLNPDGTHTRPDRTHPYKPPEPNSP